jgi:cation:H+ antiporter
MVSGGTLVQLAIVVASVAGLWVGARLLVDAVVRLARGVGLSELTIGLTIVAAGTSTPEFVVSLVAISRGSLGVSIGNVVGSNVFNLVGIMAVAALVRPLSVSPTALETFGWLLAVSVAMVVALWTGRMLSRAEGALFAGSEAVRWALGLFG